MKLPIASLKHKASKLREMFRRAPAFKEKRVAEEPKPAYVESSPLNATIHSSIRWGYGVMVVVFGVFGLWALLAPIEGAAIATGNVVLDSNHKTIQHVAGGLVKEVLVRDGDIVKDNQALILLDELEAKSRYVVAQNQYRSALANQARLKALQEGKLTIEFTAPEFAEPRDKETEVLIATQTKLFEGQQQALAGALDVLNKKSEQLQEEINGMNAQARASKHQTALLEEEIGATQTLLDKGYASKPRLLALQRQSSETQGQVADFQSRIARAKQSIAETQIEMINTKNSFQNDISQELKEVEENIADLKQRAYVQGNVLSQLVILSPFEGVVSNLQYFSAGSVIPPGGHVFDIVPMNEKMVVEARIAPTDIDIVHVGQTARIRLTAYKAKRIPILDGAVTYVSADRVIDRATNASYYLARVEVNRDELKHLHDIKLQPGMPADVLLVSGSRSFISYMMSPFSDSMYKAFREE